MGSAVGAAKTLRFIDGEFVLRDRHSGTQFVP
jgi:hypothetical protein